MASSREELRFDLIGRDVSASRVVRDLGEEARRTDRQLDELSGERVADVRVETEGSDLDAVRRDLDRISGDVTARVRVEITPPGALEDLRAGLDRMSGGVTARVRVEVTPAGALEDLRAELDRLSGGVTARVRVEESGSSLTELRADLDRVGGTTTAHVEVQLVGQLDELDVLRIRLDEVAGRTDARVVVDVEPADALAGLDRLALAVDDLAGRTDVRLVIEIEPPDAHLRLTTIREELDRLDGTRTVHIRTDVDGRAGIAGMQAATKNTGLFGTALGALGTRAKTAATGLLGLGATLAKVAVGAAAAVNVGVHLVQWVSQMAPAAALAAPAALTFGEALGVMHLALGNLKKDWPGLYGQLQGLKGQLQQTAQQGIQDGLHKAITAFVADLPIFKQGIGDMARSLGDVAAQAGALIQQPVFQGEIRTVLAGNAAAAREFGGAGLSIADAFVHVAAAAEPAFVNLSQLVAVGARQIDQWVGMKAASGDLARSITAGADSVGTFLSALFLFGQGAHSIFGALKTDGADLSTSIFNVAAAFNSWATSETTISRIKTDVAGIKTVADEASYALRQGFFNTGDQQGGWLGIVQHFGATLRELVDFVRQQVMPTFSALGSLLTGPFGSALLSVADILHQTLLGALAGLLTAVRDQLVPALGNLAPILNTTIVPALASLASILQGVLVTALGTAASIIRDDLVPALGQLGPILANNIVPAISNLANWVQTSLLPAARSLAGVFRDDLVPIFAALAPILTNDIIPAITSLATWLLANLVPAVTSIANEIRDQLVPGFHDIAATIEENKPQLEVFATGLLALGAVIVQLATVAIDLNLINSLKGMVIAIDAVITIISELMVVAAQLAVDMLDAFAAITIGFKGIFDAAAETVSGIIGVFATLPGPLGAPFRAAQGDVDAFKTKVDGDMDAAAGKARDTAASINGWLAGIQDKTVTVTIQQRVEFDAAFGAVEGLANAGRASGGPVVAGTTYWVGEQGPELFTPNVSGSITDSITSRAITSHQGDVYDGSTVRVGRGAARGWDGAAAPVVVNNYFNVTAGVVATPGDRRKLAEFLADAVTDAQANRRSSNARVRY